ncbi:MAG: hypothetical protein AAGF11_44235 [Myxococcota bacterium]
MTAGEKNVVGSTIRWATNSPVSHAMLYSGGGKVIESVGEGVREVALDTAMEGVVLAVVFRVNNLEDAVAHKVVDFARDQVSGGRRYDYRGLIAQAGYQLDRIFFSEEQARRANLWIQNSDRYFCSELVAASYLNAGRPLSDSPPAAVSPGALHEMGSNGALTYVGHLREPE